MLANQLSTGIPVALPQIPSELETLLYLTEKVYANQSEIESRLESVTVQTPESPEGAFNKEDQTLVPFAKTVRRANNLLQTICDRQVKLLQNIQL